MIKPKMKTKGGPNDIDIHVGQRVKVRRSILGLSQEKLADALGITFQQVQKYERGTNRISASRLFDLMKILNVEPNYFFEQIGSDKNLSALALGLSDNEQEGFVHNGEDIMESKETINLLKAYYSVPDEEARKGMMELVKSMAKQLKKD